MDIQQLASQSATTILEGFQTFTEKFKEITRRAKNRFETRNTFGFYNDATERLDLYSKSVQALVKLLSELLGNDAQEKEVWVGIKKNYSELITKRGDLEIAETFFNSVTRKSLLQLA
ncbi:MAG: bifunctional isocitrate dehydrogenase kinase/phosphatase [Blastocatellia bacterium]|nr:bifunctional isocitrate dehydrogenase kinase/phosphatase [Blastocatellia bacterium]